MASILTAAINSRGEIVTKSVEETDDDGNTVIEEKELVDGDVLAWGQENAPAWVALNDTIREFYDGRSPRVIDPFAGGGAIPFEAMRLGCEVTECCFLGMSTSSSFPPEDLNRQNIL